MFDFRRSLRLPLAAAAVLMLALTTACSDATGPRSDLKSPTAPSRSVQPSSRTQPAPSAPVKSDSTGGKTTNSGYNVWA